MWTCSQMASPPTTYRRVFKRKTRAVHMEEDSLVGQTDRRSSHSPSWALPSQKENLKPLEEGHKCSYFRAQVKVHCVVGWGGGADKQRSPVAVQGYVCSAPRSLGISCLGGKDRVMGIEPQGLWTESCSAVITEPSFLLLVLLTSMQNIYATGSWEIFLRAHSWLSPSHAT